MRKALIAWLVIQLVLAGMYVGDAGYFKKIGKIAPWCGNADSSRALYLTAGALWPLTAFIPEQGECRVSLQATDRTGGAE